MDLESQPIVSVLLNQESLHLIALRRNRFQADLGGEVGVRCAAHDAQRTIVRVPQIVPDAAGDRELEPSIPSAGPDHGDSAVPDRVDDRPGGT
jgi:hypothetical protein